MKKLTTEEFIKRVKEVHGNKYGYSKVKYVNNHTKVCIICPIHGEFWQNPNSHLKGIGCSKCSGYFKTTEDFIKKAKQIHEDKYGYSKAEYINNHTKVCIICPIHGEFWQTPDKHLHGRGCKKCKYQKHAFALKSSKEIFIKRAKEAHGDKYDYSKVEYINNHTKVCIICPIHGEFWQTAREHLYGSNCPQCNSSHLEEEIRLFLQENNIEFEEQKRFDWLRLQSLDFFLPQYNIGIECQGGQHFYSKEFFGGVNGLLQTKIRDERKRELCEANNIKLLYYSNLGINYPYEVFEDKGELLEEIKNKSNEKEKYKIN